jgi:hypothetical protein
MKTTILTLTTLLSLASMAQAEPLADGTYKGHGLWRSLDAQGSYEVQTTIQGNRVSSDYRLPDGSTRHVASEGTPGKNGFFTLNQEGKAVGQGYCLEKVQLCHVEVKLDEGSLEETLTNQNGKLYKFGSKTINGRTVMWQEALEK